MKSRLIYHVLLPFFARTSLDPQPQPGQRIYQERGCIHGTIRGLISRLDHLAACRVDTLWLSPIHPTRTSHGYDILDYFDLDAELAGTTRAERFHNLHQLIAQAGMRGIQVCLDLVLNHVSHRFSRSPYHATHLHPRLKGPGNRQERDWSHTFHYWDKTHKQTEEFLLEVGRFWLDQGISGFRLDYVLGRRRQFWKRFCDAMRKKSPHVFLLAEAWLSNWRALRTWRNCYKKPMFDSLFDFPLQRAISQGLRGDLRVLASAYKQSLAHCQSGFSPTVFVDSHDMPRIVDQLGNVALSQAAIMFCALCGLNWSMEYGTELGLQGYKSGMKKEESGRVPMTFSPDSSQIAWFQKFQTLMVLRDRVQGAASLLDYSSSHLLFRIASSEPVFLLLVNQPMIYKYDNASEILSRRTVAKGSYLEPGGYILRS